MDRLPLPTQARLPASAGHENLEGRHPGKARPTAIAMLIAIGCAAAFAALTALVATGNLDSADRAIRPLPLADPGTPAAWAAIVVAWAGSAPVVALTGAALVAWRFPRHRARALAAWFAVLAAAAAVEWIVKPVMSRPRPDGIVGALASARFGGGGGSFPSGHAMTAALIAVLVWQLWRGLGPRVIAVAWVAAVVLSRLALGVHWPSDVVAGVIAGIGLGLLLVVALPSRSARSPRAPGGGEPDP